MGLSQEFQVVLTVSFFVGESCIYYTTVYLYTETYSFLQTNTPDIHSQKIKGLTFTFSEVVCLWSVRSVATKKCGPGRLSHFAVYHGYKQDTHVTQANQVFGVYINTKRTTFDFDF